MNMPSQERNVEAGGFAPLLSIRGLRFYFRTRAAPIRAVDGVSFDVAGGETVALVGESGSGKSVTAMAITRLVPAPGYHAGGSILFNGADTLKMSMGSLQKLRGADIAYIFQEPSQSLNPVFTVGYQIIESLRLHRGKLAERELDEAGLSRPPGESGQGCPGPASKVFSGKGRAAASRPAAHLNFRAEAARLLDLVGISDPTRRLHSYPHELSGGMQQRVMIAMALACRPKLLVADEPTTALDVTVQAQILDLLAGLQEEFGMAVLLITHNLGIVAGMARRVNVMYAGMIVERGLTEEILSAPAHPYTRGLLGAVPRLSAGNGRMEGIPGNAPDPAEPPAGCRFHPRCPLARDLCRQNEPAEDIITGTHGVKCHFWK
ncbi:MAG: ABC transporter ATP-binding protein [Kiritimatiellia bacterium]